MLNLLYYIFILHQTTTECRRLARMLLLYYIFILHQTTTSNLSRILLTCCIISSFYIKPQRHINLIIMFMSCIISSFYIKPQQLTDCMFGYAQLYYIFILHQTTTLRLIQPTWNALYYIFILHRTTTHVNPYTYISSCIISSFYIKPQLQRFIICHTLCCIISSFYIKPQQLPLIHPLQWVVLYLHSTSNHNLLRGDKGHL